MSFSQRELFLRFLAQTSPSPLLLEIEKAEGVYLYAPNGKKYIDLISGISVSNVGHRHPKVIEAIQAQLQKYLHLMVYGEYVQSPQVLLAQKLVENLPANLDNVYFTNSGSEAVEGALKLAKRFTGRMEIISCYNAYHGSTQGALSAGGNEYFKRAYRPLLPMVKHIHYGSYSDLEQITEKTACVIIETIQGEAGVKVACSNYFQQLAVRCKEKGTLLILDEIQAGFGRTGKLWAFEHFGIVPDILVLAKGMGGGMPIGAFIAHRSIMQVFTENPVLGHITTFGGHPVSTAAAKATLEIILEENLAQQAETKAQLFLQNLKHPLIRQIRHKGLLMAVEFESFSLLKKIIDKALELGVITDWFLFCDNAMRIAPPLTISESEIQTACAFILQAIERVYHST
ncbi:aspartate aminotransferase family protein [Raineya orbicola]|jgi:acetylornithine/succinyldiaminopimelate/putrescine aminotransferase|uniref:Ornithine/acetylornithine aminotransferase n=1 Tax=Raineya orbicola TaxID=2016530 RepID=A0A2N3IK04_9BACT|nr:aspartate aminotransferase family protein [Raineya orbicola]PKQ70637.1 Ornithine/acetylornithine aminotransferase [Raineya orbicola]